MLIQESRLRQIIHEEITHRIIDQLIEEELKRIGLSEDEVDDEYEKAKRRARKKKIKNAAAALAAGTAVASPVVGQYINYSQAVSADRADREASAEAEAQSQAVKRQELIDYINNTAAFRWGKGGETMMQAPGKGGYGGTSVLPPSYSVIQQVYFDKMAGKPRYGVPESADDLRKMGQTDPSAQGNPEDNLQSFFQDFDEKYMIDAVDFMSKQAHIDQVPGTGIESEIVMVDPGELTPDYVLPENGMTVKDYYNWAYFNQFLSADEIRALNLDSPESKTQSQTIDITPEQPPGEELKSIPVQKNTWKEYRNRKKKLA